MSNPSLSSHQPVQLTQLAPTSQNHPISLIHKLDTQPLLHLFPLIHNLDTLNPDGSNFLLWESQLKALVQVVTGLPAIYLDASKASNADASDPVVRCMIVWSIDPHLLVQVNLNYSAGEAFRALKSHFSSGTLSQVYHLPPEHRAPTSLPTHTTLNVHQANHTTQPEPSLELRDFLISKHYLLNLISPMEFQSDSFKLLKHIVRTIHTYSKSINHINIRSNESQPVLVPDQSGSGSQQSILNGTTIPAHQNTTSIPPHLNIMPAMASNEVPSASDNKQKPSFKEPASQKPTETLIVPAHSRLLCLPLEILERIAYFVERVAVGEIYSIKSSRSRNLQMNCKPETSFDLPCGLYENHRQILNSFQALATVHSKFYKICRPRLWEASDLV